jgi:hypothetical protein
VTRVPQGLLMAATSKGGGVTPPTEVVMSVVYNRHVFLQQHCIYCVDGLRQGSTIKQDISSAYSCVSL